MIQLKNVSKKFDKTVLKNVNVSFKEGNIYVIKGISGSGKTTLFNILSFLDSDYEGTYLWDNKDVKTVGETERELILNNISYVFQKSFLFKKLTVKENLLFIKDNLKLIEEYSRKFNIYKLLDKKPEEVSGGERQRISLVRALLLNSKVILLDEPTSSLDKENASIFANYLKEITDDNKIIIISTHKDLYDDFANVIYSIDYGDIRIVKDNEKSSVTKEILKTASDTQSSTFSRDLSFALKRKNKRVMLAIIMFFMFLLIFVSLSIVSNLKRESLTKFAEKYPLNVFDISIYDEDNIKPEVINKYYNYKIDSENYNVYILPEKEDSAFSIMNTIKYGDFPSSLNEVLVNEEFANNEFPFIPLEEVIGKSIELNEEKFVIKGIIKIDSVEDSWSYRTYSFYLNIYDYNKREAIPAIFVPYKKMEKLGKIDYNSYNVIISVSKKDAISIYLEEMKLVDGYGDYEHYLTWLSKVKNDFYSIYNYTLIGLAIGLVAIIFIFIFTMNKIFLELYYKRKEIGYLQLYRVSKDRIHLIFLIDYFFEIIIAFACSFIVFNAICIFMYYSYGLHLFLSFTTWVILIVAFFAYFYFLVSIPVLKYLKKDILECISIK